MYREIIKEIYNFGGQAYICGGFVRDKILGIESKDIDIEVFNISEKTLTEILTSFGKWKKAGSEFELYIFENKYEFSFPRDEAGDVNQYISVEEASKRRDFTINSLYYDITSNKIYDYNEGEKDIKNKLIRETSNNNILEDPIRILRAVQFMARYSFEIEEKTKEKLITNFNLIENCKRERLFLEIEKILLKSKKPSKGFCFLQKNNLLKYIFPELEELASIIQDKIYHPEGDVFTHTMMCLDALKVQEREIDVMLALVWHDLGKAHCEIIREGERVSFVEHAKVSSEIFSKHLKRFTNNKSLLKQVKNLIYYHQAPLELMLGNQINRIEIKKIAVKTDIPKLIKVYKADVLGRARVDNSEELESIDKICRIYNEVKNELKAVIVGKDLIKLGIEPGARLGELLQELYIAQLEEKFFDKASGIEYFKTKINRTN